MKFIVKIFINKTGNKSYALIGRTTIKDYWLTFDAMAICLAMNINPQELGLLGCGEYDITN